VLTLAAAGLCGCASDPWQDEGTAAFEAPSTLRRSVQAEIEHAQPAQAAEGSLLLDPAALMRRLARRSPAIAAARARVEQARSALGQSQLHPDPTLDAGAGGAVGTRNPSDLGWSDTTNWNLGLQETFEIGKRRPRIAAANLRLEEEELRLEDLAGDQARSARAALAREAYLRARLALMEESLAAARQTLEVERGRLQNGDMSSNDFDRLTLDTTLLELDQPRTRSEHESAQADVRALLGQDCPLEQDGAAALSASVPAPETTDLDALLLARADHRALELERRAANEDA
jgi:outer membrane protein TolC